MGALCAATLSLGGCADAGSDLSAQLLGDEPARPSDQAIAEVPQNDLQKATAYWGEKFSKSPNTLEYALNYARNLKAMDRKREALAALQHASTYHAQNRELASEYGRLALELDQVQTAKSVLAFADDPTKPDWRVVSARGTVLAKEGNHKDAIPMFQRALTLSNGNVSVLNNLAMAYALDGQPAESERLLRDAAAKGQSEKVQKNLALVLSLQGKYDEAKAVGTNVMSPSTAASDTSLVRQMVQLDPKPYQPAQSSPPVAVASAKTKPTATVAALRPTSQPTPASGSWAAQVAVAQKAN